MRRHPNFFNFSTNSVTLQCILSYPGLMSLKVVLSCSIRRQARVLVPRASTLAPLGIIQPLLTQLPTQARSLLYSMTQFRSIDHGAACCNTCYLEPCTAVAAGNNVVEFTILLYLISPNAIVPSHVTVFLWRLFVLVQVSPDSYLCPTLDGERLS
ncbi:hypothetical protein B0H13DRAFT_2120844 [Mycena leptocephala]|nr:hypothetical protein B0H13DRAFT_2120844 [Mycena leptocephala]